MLMMILPCSEPDPLRFFCRGSALESEEDSFFFFFFFFFSFFFFGAGEGLPGELLSFLRLDLSFFLRRVVVALAARLTLGWLQSGSSCFALWADAAGWLWRSGYIWLSRFLLSLSAAFCAARQSWRGGLWLSYICQVMQCRLL